MPKVNKLLMSFNAGELSPLLDARIDQNKYNSGCRTMENFFPLIYGGAERRPGTYFVAEAKSSSLKCRLIDFVYSVDTAYILEFGNQYIRVFVDNGRFVGSLIASTSAWADATAYNAGDFVSASSVIYRCLISHTSAAAGGDGTGGTPAAAANPTQWAVADLTSNLYPIYELPSPYLTADLFALKVEQSADVKYITHPSYEPRKLKRVSTTTFELEELGYQDGPFIEQNTVTTALIQPVAPAWVTSTNYKVDDAVVESATNYRCLIAHTSGTFATDLLAVKWVADSKGSIRVGNSITLTATGTNADGTTFAPFVTGTTAGHSPSGSTGAATVGTSQTLKSITGSLWKFSHIRQSYKASAQLTAAYPAAGSTSASVVVYEGTSWDFVTNGIWTGRIELQRSYDNGTTWETVHTTNSENNANSQVDDTEEEADAIYQFVSYDGTASWSGTANCTFSVRNRDQEGIVEITSVSSSTSATGTVVATIGGCSATYRWAEGYWSNYRGWPIAVAISPEERLTFAGSTAHPLTIWGSKSGNYSSMKIGSNDDDAIIFTLIGSGSQSRIRWMLSKNALIIGTYGGEHKLSSSNEDEPLTPTNVKGIVQSAMGSEDIGAIVVGDAILFVQRGGRRILEIIYSFENDSYVPTDLTKLSNHITESGITNIAFQRTPEPTLWCVRDDGRIAVMSYDRQQEVLSWSVLFTSTNAGESDFESVAIIPSGSEEDSVWVSVERVIGSTTKRFIEYFSSRNF